MWSIIDSTISSGAVSEELTQQHVDTLNNETEYKTKFF